MGRLTKVIYPLEMRRDIVVFEMETNEEANKAVKEIDAVVYKVTSAANNGKVRPSASGLVRNASGLVRDASGLVRDASGLVRDASGLVRDDETVESYKTVAETTTNLSKQTVLFSHAVEGLTSLTETQDPCCLVKDISSSGDRCFWTGQECIRARTECQWARQRNGS